MYITVCHADEGIFVGKYLLTHYYSLLPSFSPSRSLLVGFAADSSSAMPLAAAAVQAILTGEKGAEGLNVPGARGKA